MDTTSSQTRGIKLSSLKYRYIISVAQSTKRFNGHEPVQTPANPAMAINYQCFLCKISLKLNGCQMVELLATDGATHLQAL
jgi:hypothetical protein